MRDSLEGAFLCEQIIEIVESLYDIGKVTAVYEIFGGFTNRSFGIDVLKDGCPKTYSMRKYQYGISVEEICFEHALIRHAIHNGFNIGAGVVMNTNGETYVQPANSRSMFAIYEYLAGDDNYTWDNPDLSDAELKSAGRVLATFHNAVYNFNPQGRQRTEPPILALWPRLAGKLTQLAQQKRDGKFHDYYAANLQSLVDMIARNPLDPTEGEGLPVIPIHCDYHPGNLKWSNEQVVGLFDLDWSKMDLRLFDVGMAVIYFCSQWDDCCDEELRFDKFRLFLRAYHNQLGDPAGLEPLTPAEQKLLPKMMGMANIYLTHWVVATYKNTEGANDYEYLTYLKHNLRLMHWLETHRAAIVKTIAEALS
ncbi:MAG: phosphotransferase [Desulfosarcina sp.]|nr:phosphotransferase [Desulfobacterales bacterium]